MRTSRQKKKYENAEAKQNEMELSATKTHGSRRSISSISLALQMVTETPARSGGVGACGAYRLTLRFLKDCLAR